MKYTKGKWKTYKNALGTWAVSTDNEPIAQVERHYNAQLIAKAPYYFERCEKLEKINTDLWEALKRVLTDVGKTGFVKVSTIVDVVEPILERSK